METKIKEIRVKLDGLTQLIGEFCPKNNNGSRELSLAYTSIQLSKMWLGKVLQNRGSENPYPESKNPANEKIEPAADIMKVVSWPVHSLTENDSSGMSPIEFTHIQKIKWLRLELEKIENELKEIYNNPNLSGMEEDEHFKDSMRCCIESGMWLGKELGRLNYNLLLEYK